MFLEVVAVSSPTSFWESLTILLRGDGSRVELILQLGQEVQNKFVAVVLHHLIELLFHPLADALVLDCRFVAFCNCVE